MAADTSSLLQSSGGVEHEFTIQDFVTESGVTLPEARVVYSTFGTLNAARNNAVLVPMHFMSEVNDADWLVGNERALRPDEHFIIVTELFGNGRSSSPSNSPPPFDGPRFPQTTIRDNVHAGHRLLAEMFGLDHVRAIVGFSMGGQQAFQWAVSYPGFADRLVATAATAKTYPHGIIRLEGQIATIVADPDFRAGDYATQPIVGLSNCGLVWAPWLFSQQWWRDELWHSIPDAGSTLDEQMDQARSSFLERDANDVILHCRTWQQHDVGGTRGFDGDTKRALESIGAPFLFMPSSTDLYFPLGDAEYEAASMGSVVFEPIQSLWGHTAGAGLASEDLAFLTRTIREFLAA